MAVKYLFAFDMDGTLTLNNSWKDIKQYYNLDHFTAHLEAKWQKGEITYEDWVKIELEYFKKAGVHRAVVAKILAEYKLTEGIKELIASFRRNAIFAIISGGFIERATLIKNQLALHYAFANSFLYNGNGYVVDIYNPVSYLSKEKILLKLIDKHNPERVVVFGDSHFDKLMWKHADYKVSLNNDIENFEIDTVITDFREVIEYIKKL